MYRHSWATSATTNFSHTAHAYYNVQYERILYSCSMEHLYYANLGYRIMNVIKHLSHITNNVSFHSSGGMTASTPSKPELSDLMDALYHRVADKWKVIGSLLNIPDGKLEAIAEKYRGDPHTCLVEMLETWLEQVDPPATWTAIIDAVQFLGEE